jgi:hypothetical protein
MAGGLIESLLDNDTFSIVATLSAGGSIVLALMNQLYQVFSTDLSFPSALLLSALGLILFLIIVLSLRNLKKISEMESES